MVKVLIKYEDNKFVSFQVKGHAKSAEIGKDLVCAAVSAVITGCYSSIEDNKNFDYKLDEGNALLKAKGTVSSHDEIVIQTMITSLKCIENEYGKFIKIENI